MGARSKHGQDDIITALNEALRAELKAVKMYAAHATAVADPQIAQGLRAILEVEETHARALALRIQALGGQPTADESVAEPPLTGPTRDPARVADMLRLDLGDEQWAIQHYAATIADALLHGDDATLAMLEENLIDELRHARWLRDQLRPWA